MTPAYLFLLFAATSTHNEGPKQDANLSRWRRRTAKRRQKTYELLDTIDAGGLRLPSKSSQEVLVVPTLQIPSTSVIQWNNVDLLIDPMQGGKIRQINRGMRKRAQVNAFYYVLSSIVETNLQSRQSKRITIIDAGCGAGNLAVALAGLFSPKSEHVSILAVDVNDKALQRLEERASFLNSGTSIETCCTDLANYEYIKSQIPSDRCVVVASLHACGAASDMAMELAFKCNNAAFVICPCCIAKALTKRIDSKIGEENHKHMIYPSTSFQRSGASEEIAYPRSNWLKNKLLVSFGSETIEKQYTALAKVADIGLGPQTPSQQRMTQNRAKIIVELDRLLSASENENYDVHLMKLPGHDHAVYGKGDLLLGAKEESVESAVIKSLFDQSLSE